MLSSGCPSCQLSSPLFMSFALRVLLVDVAQGVPECMVNRGKGRLRLESLTLSSATEACSSSHKEVRRYLAAHLALKDWCWQNTAGAASDWPHRCRGVSSEALPAPQLHCDSWDQMDGGTTMLRDRDKRIAQ